MIPTKAEIKAANTNTVTDAGLTFITSNKGECLSFRGKGEPLVDFYPSTGRWYWRLDRHSRKGYTFEGGAEKFILWFNAKIEELRKLDEAIHHGREREGS